MVFAVTKCGFLSPKDGLTLFMLCNLLGHANTCLKDELQRRGGNTDTFGFDVYLLTSRNLPKKLSVGFFTSLSARIGF